MKATVRTIVNTVTLMLESCKIAFKNAGNFLSIIELLVWYDPVLKELISQPEGSVKYVLKTAFRKTTYFCLFYFSLCKYVLGEWGLTQPLKGIIWSNMLQRSILV